MRILSRNYFFNIIFLLLLFSFSLVAQTAPKTYKILGVSVEGNTSADARTIVANSGLKIGEEIQIPGDQTIGAIKQLWSLNIFSNVEVLIEKELADGAFLLIKVEEFPRIEKAVVEGNDEISTSKLEEKINFIRGQILKTYEGQKVKCKLMKLYE